MTYAQIGGYLMGIWGLSESSVEAIAFHHCPAKSRDQAFSTLTAVHPANHIVHYNPALDRDLTRTWIVNIWKGSVLQDRVERFRSVCGDSICCGDFNV